MHFFSAPTTYLHTSPILGLPSGNAIFPLPLHDGAFFSVDLPVNRLAGLVAVPNSRAATTALTDRFGSFRLETADDVIASATTALALAVAPMVQHPAIVPKLFLRGYHLAEHGNASEHVVICRVLGLFLELRSDGCLASHASLHAVTIEALGADETGFACHAGLVSKQLRLFWVVGTIGTLSAAAGATVRRRYVTNNLLLLPQILILRGTKLLDLAPQSHRLELGLGCRKGGIEAAHAEQMDVVDLECNVREGRAQDAPKGRAVLPRHHDGRVAHGLAVRSAVEGQTEKTAGASLRHRPAGSAVAAANRWS